MGFWSEGWSTNTTGLCSIFGGEPSSPPTTMKQLFVITIILRPHDRARAEGADDKLVLAAVQAFALSERAAIAQCVLDNYAKLKDVDLSRCEFTVVKAS